MACAWLANVSMYYQQTQSILQFPEGMYVRKKQFYANSSRLIVGMSYYGSEINTYAITTNKKSYNIIKILRSYMFQIFL